MKWEHMASICKIATLKRKLKEYRLQLEMCVALFVALNPDLSYRQIGRKLGYPASWICEIAKKHGKNRGSKAASTEIKE
jgi:hypothetical protein